MKIKTKDIVISGILGGIAIFLGQTGLGFIPLPTGVNATIMHIPVILGAVLEGPVVGVMVGFIFGFFSWIQPRSPFFAYPTIAILPRLFIGIVSYYIYRWINQINGRLALVIAGVVGSLTNTILVLGMIVVHGFLPGKSALYIAYINGIPEAIIAGVIVYFVGVAVKRAREEKI